jgi:hypothetical protein
VEAEDLCRGALDRRVVDPLTVRRVRRREVVGVILRERRDGFLLDVVRVEVRPAALHPAERDVLAVGGEGRIELLVDARHRHHLLDVAAQGVQQEQLAPALATDEEGDRVPVGGDREVHAAHRARREPLRDDVLVLGLEALRQVAEELALAGGEDDDVRVLAERRDGGAEVARRERPDGELGRALLGEPHAVAEVDRLALLGQDLDVTLPEEAAEPDVEVLRGDVERAFEDAVDVRPELAAVLEDEVADAVAAPLGLHEVEDGVAEPVREEPVDLPLGDLRHLVREDGVAQDHAVLRVLVAREVGRHALRQPLRRAGGVGAEEVAAEEDLELEDVGQLVRDQLLEREVGHVDREHHAVARRQRKRPDVLRQEAGHRVRLLELRVRAVIDDVDRLRDLEVQRARDVVVGALGV